MENRNKVELHEIFNNLKEQKNEYNFNKLYEGYGDLAYKIAFSLIRNKENSEDIKQKVFLKIWQMEKEIVSLKILSNLSFREISDILDEPIGTIQWRYYKSLHTLKILLSNLSMFIISITIFISRITKDSYVNKATLENPNVQENLNESLKEEIENDKNSTYDRVENANINNEIIQDNTITETIIVDGNKECKLNNLDIGILSISGIFLIFTIIFSIIFIKHQQKAIKKVSK